MLQVLVTKSQAIAFPTMRLPLGNKPNFIFDDPAAPHYLTKPDLMRATSKKMGRRKSSSVSFPSHGDKNKLEEDGIFTVFTGAYTRGECSSDSLLERMKSRRARAMSTAGYESHSDEENESCTSNLSFCSSDSSSDLSVLRRRFVPEAPQKNNECLTDGFRQPTDYDQRCKISLISPIHLDAVLSALDDEQEFLSMQADALIKKSGWHDRPCVGYAAMFGNPEPDEDALLGAAELAKDLYVRVILLSGNSEAKLGTAATAGGVPSIADGAFASVFNDLDACPHPEPTGYILRYLVISCANVYWDPHSAIYDLMLRRDALGLLSHMPETLSVTCPQLIPSPMEGKIYNRAIGLIAFSGALFARSILRLDDFKSLIKNLLVNVVCIARSQALLVLLCATGPELGARNLKPILRALHEELKLTVRDPMFRWAYGVSDSLHVCASLASSFVS